ncbi:MAG: hypothetical protein ACD_78C00233G0002 [uncultured bacterium (gcode 4)]|uniref:Peptidase C39 domain-containing protein n=1 Tax=uncultured bacterium (gcode 4) TaxID=1234023 RepID=K1XY05_9BACT|nr:MAG: hypothetical protein ACD_78C00233G0002 [uncultured bacterium (gcode 4)]
MIHYYHQETDYTCAPACIRMILSKYDIFLSEKEIEKGVGCTSECGTDDDGEILKFFTSRHFEATLHENWEFTDLKKFLDEGYDIIINYFISKEQEWHYAIVENIDDQYITLIDPEYWPDTQYPPPSFYTNWHNSSGKLVRSFITMKKTLEK